MRLSLISLDDFYRATLYVRAVFVVVRCPSVCLSVTFVCCIQTAEDIVKFLPRHRSPSIRVFLTAISYFDYEISILAVRF